MLTCIMKKMIGMAMVFLSVGGAAFARFVDEAPEIDPSSGAAALALLSGGMLVLRSRRKK